MACFVFDVDGTLADASHRLHFITDDPNNKDWDSFLADDQVAKDAAIPAAWEVLNSLLWDHHKIIFITGRKEDQREMTYKWLRGDIPGLTCEHRAVADNYWDAHPNTGPIIYMRGASDRRPSHIVKEASLKKARADGFDPIMAFEDRKDDTAMWRRNGLLCAQVQEGNY